MLRNVHFALVLALFLHFLNKQEESKTEEEQNLWRAPLSTLMDQLRTLLDQTRPDNLATPLDQPLVGVRYRAP